MHLSATAPPLAAMVALGALLAPQTGILVVSVSVSAPAGIGPSADADGVAIGGATIRVHCPDRSTALVTTSAPGSAPIIGAPIGGILVACGSSVLPAPPGGATVTVYL